MKKLEEMRIGIATINDASSVAFLNFAHNNFKLDENGGEFSKWVENTMGAKEIAFSHGVFKYLYCRHVETRACLGKIFRFVGVMVKKQLCRW